MLPADAASPPTALQGLLERLFSRINYERREPTSNHIMRTESIGRLLELLNHPHRDYPIIHVAGTKGKGSVTKLSAKLLAATGMRVAAYTSPHLWDFRERFTIDEQLVSDRNLEQALGAVFQILDAHEHEPWASRLTFFDLATATGFLIFSRERVDAAVIEVGLGGRLDSTNVCQPSVCVITNISFDHMRQLGNTLAEIAYAKAGIIKSGVPVVCGVEVTEPRQVIEQVAGEEGCRLIQLGEALRAANFQLGPSGTTFDAHIDFLSPPVHLSDLEISLLGRHQVDNAVLSLGAVHLFLARQNSPPLGPEKIRETLKNFQHPGRIQIACRQPTVVLDVAHNEASIRALIETLRNQLEAWRLADQRVLILAASKDKDHAAMLRICLPAFDRIVFTRFLLNPRATPPTELMALAGQLQFELRTTSQLECVDNPHEAWNHVRAVLSESSVCCIAGSLFLVGELKDTVESAYSGKPRP